MNVYGSIKRLVSAVFRKNSQEITLRPNQATTYSAARDIQFPAGDVDHVLISASSTATFTNKTFDADGTGNSISNIENADIKSGAAIDASKIADGSVSNAEFQYIGGLTSDAQTQISGKVSKAGDTLTGDLIMDDEKGIQFREEDANGDHYVYVKAPATLAGNVNFVLPNSNGTSGYVLSTDGSGGTSWIANSETVSHKEVWETADTATFAVTHNLGSLDVICQVVDVDSGDTIYMDRVERTDTNTVTFYSSEAPPATDWRVLILKV